MLITLFVLWFIIFLILLGIGACVFQTRSEDEAAIVIFVSLFWPLTIIILIGYYIGWKLTGKYELPFGLRLKN